MTEGKVPIREVVGAALRFLRENIGPLAAAAAIAAVATTLIAVLATRIPALALLLSLLSSVVAAFLYAAYTGAVLNGASGMAQRAPTDGGRVWASMAIIGFFLLIVFTVLMIPGVIVFVALIAGRYGTEIQEANGDQAATISLMERIFTENPGILLGFVLFYGLIWLLLTSRLYLAAPASVDQKRILTFETWPWTKGNMWRILGARAMLLFPAYVLVSAVAYLGAGALGLNMMDPESLNSFVQTKLPLYVGFSLVSNWVQFVVYTSLEAGLSAYLYRGLKPPTAAPAPLA